MVANSLPAAPLTRAQTICQATAVATAVRPKPLYDLARRLVLCTQTFR